MKTKSTFIHVAAMLWCTLFCISAPAAEVGKMSVSNLPTPAFHTPPGFDLEPTTAFDHFLKTDIPPTDGFDFPVGDLDGQGSYHDRSTGQLHKGWYVYVRFGQRYSYGIHPGEDWNGSGQGNSDEGQPVHAVGRGLVVVAQDCIQPTGGVVIIQHVFYENHKLKRIRSVYKHLIGIRVKPGQLVERRQMIGEVGRDAEKRFVAHLHLEMRWDESLSPAYWPSARKKSLAWIKEHYANPSAFIRSHRRLFVPQEEENLVLIHPASYRMRVYRNGRSTGEYQLGYGHLRGAKTPAKNLARATAPRGMYFVVERHRGLTGGDFGKRSDSYRVRVNFPNPYDAARGGKLGLIQPQQESRIKRAWQERRTTPRTTLLNRGAGFKGWLQEFDDSRTRNHYWGSLLLHQHDFKAAFEHLPLGAMVVIF